MATLTTISDMIRSIRGKRSMAEFGRSLGVSRQAVHQWEIGATTPRESILRTLKITVLYHRRGVK